MNCESSLSDDGVAAASADAAKLVYLQSVGLIVIPFTRAAMRLEDSTKKSPSMQAFFYGKRRQQSKQNGE